jgi:hypothetical protein
MWLFLGVNENVLPLVILEKKGYVFHKEVKVMPMNIVMIVLYFYI